MEFRRRLRELRSDCSDSCRLRCAKARTQNIAPLSLEGVSQMDSILPERLLALVRPGNDLVLRRIRSLKRCAQACGCPLKGWLFWLASGWPGLASGWLSGWFGLAPGWLSGWFWLASGCLSGWFGLAPGWLSGWFGLAPGWLSGWFGLASSWLSWLLAGFLAGFLAGLAWLLAGFSGWFGLAFFFSLFF